MNGVAVPSAEVAPPVKQMTLNPAASNAVRLLAQNLAMCAQHKPCDVDYFLQLCITLSRGMDNAIASEQVPAEVSELPKIFKLVCQRRNECSLQAPLMVLMLTVKNACKAQWFSSKESQELLALTDEVVSVFCTPEGFSCEQENIIPTVSQIISRYYPQLKLGPILASVVIKPGFEACAMDFHISKTRLLLAMKDNIDTSSCIINPSKVNILLNGRGLQGRMVGCMYQGPQLPTIVNPMLRYGTNLLQAIGDFDAHYIVLVAIMSVIRPSDLPAPCAYIQPPAAAVDSEAEIIEGPSKISLNCPISFTRIRQPVKGHLCKHLQCFDLSNFIEINFKRPSWRCPHCSQTVCYPDIRIDQRMLKILQEVGEGVTNVIIHSDGSWQAASGCDGHKDDSLAKGSEGLQPDQQDASGLLTGPSNVYDLTEGNDEMISLVADAPEDRKVVVQPDLQSKAIHTNLSVQTVAGDPSQAIQNSATQAQGIPSSGPSGNSCGQADHNTSVNPEASGIVLPPGPVGHYTPLSVLTHSVPPAANREQHPFLGTSQQSSSLALFHPPSNHNLWLLELQHRQRMNNVCGGYAIPANVSSTPAAAQIRPVQIPSSNPSLSSRSTFMNSLQPNNSYRPLHTSLLPPLSVSTNPASTQMDYIQQQFISQSQMQQSSIAQMRSFREAAVEIPPQPNPLYQPPSPMVFMPPRLRATSQVPPGRSISSGLNQTAFDQMAVSPLEPSWTPIHATGGSGGGTPRTFSRTEDLLNVDPEQNWQPTGRMRGSLAGRPYREARDQLMIRPTAETTPAPNQNNIPPQLQVLLANRNLYSQNN